MTSRTRSAQGAASGAHSLWFVSLVRARERNPRAGRARKGEGRGKRRIKAKAKAGFQLALE
ncbi:MAG: hypothetical protein JSS42_15845 [Proteobacteria bacterium]|nr:hypothetical protein [Pseudomonadota bacterium]